MIPLANAYEAGQSAGELFPFIVIGGLLLVVIVLLEKHGGDR